ncbi:probable xyloglucan endotransglucosylase/hydrolase protein 30 [Zingiber officinale]|uniref:probable xyloglucan endotransglucosylase/hydrolase protein 30 n=1 Tax=Zingiber officinale TaxID=94328 RepID=UPI001C4B6DE0|nr:probable xyloglucan endotransglucosylase/hydrolase protein 30 [Zingiber officinale]
MAADRVKTTLLLFSLLAASTAALNVTTLSFDDGFSHLFGNDNLVRSGDGRGARLILNRYSGSGFISRDLYHHGFFSASIKLPADYTAGVVVAFYASNGDVFEKTHDELDLEFLGNIRGRGWRIQTNVYGNGSTSRGREERYVLPFDPIAEAHQYSILWTADRIVFYIDDVPIREVVRSDAMGGDYPSKPMSVYATIWDGSTWATANGKYKVDYKYAPFAADLSDLVLQGCRVDPIQQADSARSCADAQEELRAADIAVMTRSKHDAMRRFRRRYMTYSFCYDTKRYPVPFPDCDIIPSEQSRFLDSGHSKFRQDLRRSRRQSRKPRPAEEISY